MGHGTIINGTGGQDDPSVMVNVDDGNDNYSTGEQTFSNSTSGDLNPGDVVEVGWSDENKVLCVLNVGTRATGDVNENGDQITITKSGDTALRVNTTVNISPDYGTNGNAGFSNATGVSCANVSGVAGYLEEG